MFRPARLVYSSANFTCEGVKCDGYQSVQPNSFCDLRAATPPSAPSLCSSCVDRETKLGQQHWYQHITSHRTLYFSCSMFYNIYLYFILFLSFFLIAERKPRCGVYVSPCCRSSHRAGSVLPNSEWQSATTWCNTATHSHNSQNSQNIYLQSDCLISSCRNFNHTTPHRYPVQIHSSTQMRMTTSMTV